MGNPMEETHRYDDIIDLPHHVSATHPQMSLGNRAAQFLPFAALSGHGEAIRETGRLTVGRMEPDEDVKVDLDRKLAELKESLTVSGEAPEITVTYFTPDERKAGGAYVAVSGLLKKIDEYEGLLVMQDGRRIPIQEIIELFW